MNRPKFKILVILLAQISNTGNRSYCCLCLRLVDNSQLPVRKNMQDLVAFSHI